MTHEPGEPVLAPEVATAISEGRPVVALESTILAHGLPRPDNLQIGREIEGAVRATGAVPATIGVIGGRVLVGLDDAQLEQLTLGDGVHKLSARDLPVAVAKGLDGATTVASTAAIAAAVGIEVFATGGLGGVHRDAAHSFDESADLVTLARTPVLVVCSGVKSILDVPATLERLETLSVAVVGYGTNAFPGFYLTDSGSVVDWRVDTPQEAAAVLAARRGLTAIIIANPLPLHEQLDPALHDRVLVEGLARAARDGVTGKAVTPYLLAHLHRATEGQSLAVNVRIILRNAELAGRIAAARHAARVSHQ